MSRRMTLRHASDVINTVATALPRFSHSEQDGSEWENLSISSAPLERCWLPGDDREGSTIRRTRPVQSIIAE